MRHRTRYEGCRGVRDEIYSGARLFGFSTRNHTFTFSCLIPAATSIIPCLIRVVSVNIGTRTGATHNILNMEKTTIKPILQRLEVGDECEFPILKATSVSNTVSQRMIQEKLDGKRYTVKRDWERRKVTVTRVS